MILSYNDERRQKFFKKGNILRNLRNNGGAGNGLMAGGIVLLVFGILLFALFAALGRAAGGLFFGVILGIPGLLLFLFGMIGQKRKAKEYLTYYQEETGFSLEELRQVEQELMEPDMVMIGNVPTEGSTGASEKNPQIACMMTKHYFVMPMLLGKTYIRRYPDIVLAAYSEQIPGVGGYKHGLVFLSRKDDIAYYNAFLTRDVCDEVICELRQHCPRLITDPVFSVNDTQYDVIVAPQDILHLVENA